MRIGICSHITLSECMSYFDATSRSVAVNIITTSAPSVDALVRGLIYLGHDVVVFVHSISVENIVVLSGAHLKVYVCPRRKRPRNLAFTFFNREVRYLRMAVARETLDVIHAQWTYEYTLGILNAKCPKISTIRDVAEKVLFHVRDAYRLFRYFLNGWTFYCSRDVHFVANSAYTAAQIEKYHPWVKCRIIPNSVKDEFVLEDLDLNRKPIIMSVAVGTDGRKNLESLVNAFALVRKEVPNAELWLVGNAFVTESDFVKRVKSVNPCLLDNVRLCGRVPHDQLVDYYKQAMILMHPSLEETFGNILIEAMGCGAVAIGGEKSGAVPWVLDYGRAGVLCDVRKSVDIAEKILVVIKDDNFRIKIAKAGNARVKADFTSIVVAEQTVAYYKELLG